MSLDLDWASKAGVGDGLYKKMTEDSVPAERYYAESFAELERERMWAHAWQPACRIEEIPKVGDYSEYTINDQSYLVVRASETEIKAYYNHCRHRGNELGNGNGSYRSGEIVCSFHGWRWNLDGTNSKVLGPQGFTPACLDPERLRLREVRVETALGMVWINPDHDAASMESTMGEVVSFWDQLKLSDMRVRWWRYMKVDANWKTVMEPFMEAYHIAQTHPEITHHTGVDRWNIDAVGNAYKVTDDGSGWGDYAGRGAVDGIPPSPIPGLSAIDFSVISNKALHDGIDAALMQTWQLDIQQELYHEKGLRDFEYILAFNQRLYEEADRRGMAILPADQGGGAAYGFVFPNIVITASYGNAFIQRTRPDSLDPEKTIVEFYAVSLPQNDDQVKRPKRIGPLEYEDWGFVVQQDLSNIEKVQRGVKTKGFTDAFFSGTYEALIVNFHRTLETYIDRY